jgi:hypothetical protein
MQVIDVASVPLKEIPHIREGVFRSRKLLTGTEGSPGNFALQLVTTPETYYSPRHRHNFEQVRYQIEGDFDFSADGKMKPGTIGYFPEGTHYGPQSSKQKSLTLVLQFGGASASGYISTEQYARAAAELAETGSFEKGVYTRPGKDGVKVNQDAYEAVWEQVNGRSLVYPKQRYASPVFMDPAAFHWLPLARYPGVSRKLLGVFSECEVQIALYQLQPGASLPLRDNAIYFVDNGSGRADGHGYEKYTTLYLLPGESGNVTAQTESVLLQLGLPQLD